MPWAVHAAGYHCGVSGLWKAGADGLLTFVQAPAGGAGGPAFGDVSLQAVGAGGSSVGFSDDIASLFASFAATGAVPAGMLT